MVVQKKILGKKYVWLLGWLCSSYSEYTSTTQNDNTSGFLTEHEIRNT